MKSHRPSSLGFGAGEGYYYKVVSLENIKMVIFETEDIKMVIFETGNI